MGLGDILKVASADLCPRGAAVSPDGM